MAKVNRVGGATMLLLCGGALVACQTGTTPAAAPSATVSPSTTTPPSATVSPSTTTPASPASSPSAAPTTPAPTGSTPAGTGGPVLSGAREVTMVRVQGIESGVSLDNGELTEADDDSGRQLFVLTPVSGGHLIKAYGKRDGHPASDEPACWQAHKPGGAASLRVRGAVCDAGDPRQRFEIMSRGAGAYAISNASAFLQASSSGGLILEELGDAPLRSTFRLVDNGPARRPAGG